MGVSCTEGTGIATALVGGSVRCVLEEALNEGSSQPLAPLAPTTGLIFDRSAPARAHGLAPVIFGYILE